MKNIEKTEILNKLELHKKENKNIQLRDLFANDPERFEKFSVKFNDILLDYSKNLINSETMSLLTELAEKSGLHSKIESMFGGDRINFTENRAVLHTALRNLSGEPVFTDGIDVMPEIISLLDKAMNFADAVRNGIHKGYTGKVISDVINIGIGGSHLGPDMVCAALAPYSGNVKVHFVSNVDPTDITEKLKMLNPETTLFLIASKTFTTQETMANAEKAREWFLEATENKRDAVAKHFAALSTNISACENFGISKENIFGFWDWVGGRYSVWSVIGLSVAISVGSDNFRHFLKGAYEMDRHFRTSSFNQNLPVILALLGVWYNNFWGAATHAVIPYDQYLVKFTEFLQQLDMESNGKRVNKTGEPVDYQTGAVVWGTIGTNSQHSFFQLLHQGTQLIPVDFIGGIESRSGDTKQHDILMSNFFAQTEALMKGKNENEVRRELENSGLEPEEIEKLLPHKIFTGNKPTNTILYQALTPETLGSLIAMYEHKVFVQGVIWEINSFDQWGVELGKQLAKGILNDITDDKEVTSHDSSTNSLLNYYMERKGK